MPVWSKLKRAVEKLLADSVKAHLQFYATRYGPGVSHFMRRAWMTWDGREIAAFSNIELELELYPLVGRIQADDASISSTMAWEQAERLLFERGKFSRWDFQNALTEYISLSIDEALRSPNTLIRAWSMFDRRLGKRRLRTLRIADDDALLVRQCYQLRIQAEGIVTEEIK